MTDILAFLDEFAETESLDELRALARADHGIELNGIYCLHTGRLIGAFNDDELIDAIADESYDTQEELVDALVVRVVASMRPSPALNKPDRFTIRQLCARRPIDATAYLLNRLYGNRQTLRLRDETSYSFLFERVKTHQTLTAIGDTESVGLIRHWLLELDSKLNLHEVSPPMFEKDRLGKWMQTKIGTVSLLQFLEDSTPEEFREIFEAWAFGLVENHSKTTHTAELQAAWSRGNQMTGPAYVQSYLENPDVQVRKEIMRRPLRETFTQGKRNRNPAKMSEKTRKLNQQVGQFMSMLDGILGGTETVKAPKPEPKKSRVFTAGALFAKKAN